MVRFLFLIRDNSKKLDYFNDFNTNENNHLKFISWNFLNRYCVIVFSFHVN